MAVDLTRVAAVYAAGPYGPGFGSGYVVGPRMVLTAAHIFRDAAVRQGAPAEVHLPGKQEWIPGVVRWLSEPAVDLAVIEVTDTESLLNPAGSVLRWGRVAGGESVTAAAVGFPWAQQRRDAVRDTEHIVGFISPGAGMESNRLSVTVVSAPPAARGDGGSPWAGISGAALLVGPYLVGVLLADPVRYGTERLVAVPITELLGQSEIATVLGLGPELDTVGGEWRLEYAPGRSLRLTAPYRPLPLQFNVAAARYRLLYPEHGILPFAGRGSLVDQLTSWCEEAGPGLALHTLTGAGGSGKTRLAAEVCVALVGRGWDAGFADGDSPGGTVKWQLDRPTLLVVDDADLNLPLAADLISSLESTDVPVRLLLIARSRYPWWRSLARDTDSAAIGLDRGDLQLDLHRLDLPARVEIFEAALVALSRALPPVPEPGSATSTAQKQLADEAYAEPLMIHLAALLVASGEMLSVSDGVQVKPALLRAVLERETARWQKQLARERERGTQRVEVLWRCVAVATISAPDDEKAGAAMLKAVPDLVDAGEGWRRTLADWLHWLHSGGEYWNPIRPDPLADQLLSDLDVLPELVLAVADALTVRTLDRLLVELTRASVASGGFATAAMRRLLEGRLAQLIDTVIANPDGGLPQRLFSALQHHPVPDAAAANVHRLPSQSLALRDVGEALHTQTVDYYRSLAKSSHDAFLPTKRSGCGAGQPGPIRGRTRRHL